MAETESTLLTEGEPTPFPTPTLTPTPMITPAPTSTTSNAHEPSTTTPSHSDEHEEMETEVMHLRSDRDVDYTEGEKVLAFHQSLVYEAKVLSTEMRPNPANPETKKKYYLLHYAGWNERWDEWVDSTRILKDNEENRKLQEELRSEHKRTVSSKMKGNSENKSKKRKLGQDKVVDVRYKYEIPLSLKKKLVDDWNNITCQKYLVVLPKSPSASEILDQHLTVSGHAKGSKQDEIISSFKLYFDKVLGTFLLYRFERQQYADILKKNPDITLSTVYGIEHLLRLLVKFPQLMAGTEMDDDTVQTVKSTLQDLVRFLEKNYSTAPAIYEPATPQYIRMVS